MATDAEQLRLNNSCAVNRSAKGPTMRVLILILILALVVFLILLASGFVSVNQTRSAKTPQVSATGNGITAKGGQAPAFDVETGSVKVGAKETTVKMPALVVKKAPNGQAQAPAKNAM